MVSELDLKVLGRAAMSEKRRGETDLIAHYFAPLASQDASFGLSDDVAFLSPPNGYDLVVTKDLLVADIHFFANDPAKRIAQKALRVNLSDLAAKGAKPYGYLLGLGLPQDWSESWLKDFVDGLKDDQALYDFALFGGDTVKSPDRLTLSVTAFGLVSKGCQIIRRNAQVGDCLYMSGTLGDAALGLLARLGTLPTNLDELHKNDLMERYLLPLPRTELRQCLLDHAHAGMDISDGLLGDAKKMALASETCLHIDVDAVPLSDAVRAALRLEPSLIRSILGGGDDYELLMAIAPDKEAAFLKQAQELDQKVTKIGVIEQGAGLQLSSSQGWLDGQDMLSFEHF